MMPDQCLINYNARIYNPTIGKFTAADPVTQDVTNLQDLNRYAYVTDNPLSLTDPSGYVHNGGGFFKTPLAHELEGIAVAVLLDQWFLPAVIEPMLGLEVAANTGQVTVLSTINAGISGGASGAVSTGTLNGGNSVTGATIPDEQNPA